MADRPAKAPATGSAPAGATNPASPAIETDNLVRTYRAGRGRGREPTRALDGVSLRIERGSWVALLGPNGSGKSTLLRILATMDARHEGTARVLGRDLSSHADAAWCRSRLGVVFQRPALDPLLTVRETLAIQGAMHGLNAGARAQRADRVASLLGVAARLDDRVGTLSGGLARRVDLARALVPEPELLLLDEATVGLDPEARAALLAALADLRTDKPRPTIVMSTHLVDEAEYADRVVMLHAGSVVADGTPDELRASLGGWVVRCEAGEADAAESLRGCGLEPEAGRNGAMRAPLGGEGGGEGQALSVESVAAALAERGIGFSITPPTLADAYLHLTGAALDGKEGAAP